MTLLAEYRGARRDEDLARLRRVLALRAMAATGMSQREIAALLGITQPAVSQQLKELSHIHGWLRRVGQIVERGKDAYLADALLQEAGD